MAKLLLKFNWFLGDRDKTTFWSLFNPGLQFHRWLPNGEKDAILLPVGAKGSSLKIWFERRGYEKDGWIEYDLNRKEMPLRLLKQIGLLNAGPMFGKLWLGGITRQEASTLKKKVGNDAYQRLGKKVIKLIVPSVQRLIHIFKTKFGQDWIIDFPSFDSRRQNLTNYFNGLNCQWSLDEGETWDDFSPDHPEPSTIKLEARFRPNCFENYLTQKDWLELPKYLETPSSPAATLLANAIGSFRGKSFRVALVDGVTALEMAIGEGTRDNFKEDNQFNEFLGAFWNLPLRTQLVCFVTLKGISDKIALSDTLDAIDLRHKVVHEGFIPSQNAENKIRALLLAAGILLHGPKFNIVYPNPGNQKY